MKVPITVIVPFFQAEKYIAETIESILTQTYAPQEILLVNDGSTDQSMEILKQYKTLRILENPSNMGQSATLNRGINAASQPWLSFLDADDLWHPNKLEKQWIRILQDETNATSKLYFTHIEQFVSPELPVEEQQKVDIKHPIIAGIAKTTLLTHKSVFDRTGLFDTQWKIGDFVDWYVRCKEIGITDVIIGEVLARRRLHTSNMSRQLLDQRNMFAKIMMASLHRRKQQKESNK